MEGKKKKKGGADDKVDGNEPRPKPKKKQKPVQDEGQQEAETPKKAKKKKAQDAQNVGGADEKKPKKKKVKIAQEPEATSGTQLSRPQDEEDSVSLYEDAIGTNPSYFGSNPLQEFRPTTLTGISELPVKDFFLILLLWSPRFLVPWISAWHEFNVFILADPASLEAKENQLFKVDLMVFAGACLMSIITSVIADMASMRYYVYMVLLIVYALCPIAGGYVDVALRLRMYDHKLYNHWYTALVLMRVALSIPFLFFPVQFTCIFTEKANMSRQAHYNWAAFFALLEFVNAYIAFWVIPPKCPSTSWKQITVWVIFLAILYLIIVLTIAFSLIVKSMRYTLMGCLVPCGLRPEKYLGPEYNEKAFKDRIPKRQRLKKLMWFSLLLIPLVFSSFVFATLERFVPDEDWDKHYVLSATSMFYLGRVLGVVVMVVALFWIRHGVKKIMQIPIFRGDVLVLGLPHLFNILALLILVGRFATLSSVNPGDVIIGPVPSENNTNRLVVFINQMYRNKTVCVSADDAFRPVKVRAYHFAAREYNPGVTPKVSFTPEPGGKYARWMPLHRSRFANVELITINLYEYLNKDAVKNETKYREYMNVPKLIWYAPRRNSRDAFGDQRDFKIPTVPSENNITVQIAVIRNFYVPYDFIILLGDSVPSEPNNVTSWQIKVRSSSSRYTHDFITLSKGGTWYAAAALMYSRSRYDEHAVVSPISEFHLEEYSWYVLSFYHIAPIMERLSRELYVIDLRAKAYRIAAWAPPAGELPSKKVLQIDKAIQAGMTFAGMSAGGLFVGIVYLFWMDPPFPGMQTTALAVFWTLMIGAAESPKVKLVDVGVRVSTVLLVFQILLTGLHVFASMNFYTPEFNFRKRPD